MRLLKISSIKSFWLCAVCNSMLYADNVAVYCMVRTFCVYNSHHLRGILFSVPFLKASKTGC